VAILDQRMDFAGDRIDPGQQARSAAWASRLAGNVEAADEAAAIEKGAAEFKVSANRLMAVKR
jgi:hypothetical protein